jgi:hypothetical protein
VDDLALSGRGVPIVGELGLLWFVVDDLGKTVGVRAQEAADVREPVSTVAAGRTQWHELPSRAHRAMVVGRTPNSSATSRGLSRSSFWGSGGVTNTAGQSGRRDERVMGR